MSSLWQFCLKRLRRSFKQHLLKRIPGNAQTSCIKVGFGHALRGADQRKGAQTCQNAYVLSKTIGNQPLQIYALSWAMFSLTVMGDFSAADELAKEIDNLVGMTPFPGTSRIITC